MCSTIIQTPGVFNANIKYYKLKYLTTKSIKYYQISRRRKTDHRSVFRLAATNICQHKYYQITTQILSNNNTNIIK